MKKGTLYIDGKDAWEEYGVYVTEDGWNAIIAYPPLKTPTSNDWQEYAGKEVDLSAPVLNTREVEIAFGVHGLYSQLSSLVVALSDGAYHTLRSEFLGGREWKVRVVSFSNLSEAVTMGTMKVKVADDFPERHRGGQGPESSVAEYDDYELDGLPFTWWGVRVLEGTLDELKTPPAVKKNLLRNIATQSGAIYDADGGVTFDTKDAKVYCLLRAKTFEELWRNYDALLYDLTKPEERSIWVRDLELDFPCYYKSCSVTDFFPDEGKLWLQFTLTMTLTGGTIDTSTDAVLATEVLPDVVGTEETDENSAVNLSPDKVAEANAETSAEAAETALNETSDETPTA